MKKISIIIPSYNAGDYILSNLKILCRKKYRNFIEVIVVDDGSTDNTKEIVTDYIKNFDFVKYVYQKNAGASAARNNGISLSTGDYVVFLDSDDMMYEDALDKIYSLIEKNDYDLIIGNFSKVDTKGNLIENVLIYKENQQIMNENKFLLACDDPKPGSKIYNLKLIKKNKLFFDNLKIGQDLNFFLKYLLISNNILLINDYIYKYRIVNGSISRTYSLKILKIIETFELVEKYYKENKAIDALENYIEISKLCRYYFQYCKLRYFDNKKDRKIVYQCFKKEFHNLKINKSSPLYIKNKRIYYKFYIRILFGNLFISNLYCKLYRIIHGKYHMN